MFTHSADFFWMASVAVALSTVVLMLLIIFALLWLKHRRQQAHQRDLAFVAQWQAVMIACAIGDALPELPTLHHRADDWRLLKLWIHTQMLLQGEARARLRVLAQRMKLDQIAMRFYHSPSRSEKILSLMCLGFLKELHTWPMLESLVHEKSQTIAVHAAWALLELDADKAAAIALEVLMSRNEVDLVQVSTLFKPLNASLQSVWLKQFQNAQASTDVATRAQGLLSLLRIAHALEMPLEDAWLWPVLTLEPTVDLLIAVLRLLKQVESRSRVVPLASHQDWQVRTQVASTLGRLGTSDDLVLLETLASDSQWWVRYRAAQSLVHAAWISRDTLLERVSQWHDRYAKDMLHQVLAEF